MKTVREHRVLLCGRALEILDAARKLGDDRSPLTFVNERGEAAGRKAVVSLATVNDRQRRAAQHGHPDAHGGQPLRDRRPRRRS